MTAQMRVAATLAIITLAITGCADPHTAPAPAQQPSSSTLGTYHGAISSRIMLRDEGISLDPPTSDDQPQIDWQRALDVCSDGSGECGDNGTPDVYLAVATDTDGGSDSTGRNVLRHDLAYILEWHGERCAPVGVPPQPPGSTRSPAQRTYSCGLFDFVSAKTGRFVTAIESPGL
jgi:hypothetical protein